MLAHGGGKVVSVYTFYSDNPSLNPAEDNCYYCKMLFEKKENKQKKRPGLAHFLKKEINSFAWN